MEKERRWRGERRDEGENVADGSLARKLNSLGMCLGVQLPAIPDTLKRVRLRRSINPTSSIEDSDTTVDHQTQTE